jgi:hypothetical protein
VSQTTTVPSVAHRPRRRWVRRLVLAFTTVAGLYVSLFACANWRARNAWQAACAEADRLDPGWRWEVLAARLPEVSPEQNSAERVKAAHRSLPRGWPDRKQFGRALAAVMPGDKSMSPPQRRLPAEAAIGLRSMLDDVVPGLAEARAVAECPTGRIARPRLFDNGDQSAFDYFSVAKSLLYPHLALQADAGEIDDACVTALAILYTAGPLSDRGTVLDVLVADAVRTCAARGVERILAQGEPSHASLHSLRRSFAQEVERPTWLNAFRGERAWIEDLVRASSDGRLPRTELDRTALIALFEDPRGWTGWSPADRWISRLTSGNHLATASAGVRYLNWVIERLKESPDGLRAHEAEWVAMQAQQPPWVSMRMGWIVRYVADARSEQAVFRSAVAGLAAEQFRRTNGHWPTSLNELFPAFLTALPRDPFDLQALRLVRVPDGIVIYSVGPDGTDDGGDVVPGKNGRDIGIRLWDPDKRRQRALPAAPDGKTK